jgi:hypothetical protein
METVDNRPPPWWLGCLILVAAMVFWLVVLGCVIWALASVVNWGGLPPAGLPWGVW